MSTVFLVVEAADADAQGRAPGKRVGGDDANGIRRHKDDSMVPMKEGRGASDRRAALLLGPSQPPPVLPVLPRSLLSQFLYACPRRPCVSELRGLR